MLSTKSLRAVFPLGINLTLVTLASAPKRPRRNNEKYNHLYHKNAIENRETIAARAQKRPRLTHSSQLTVAQTVAGSHPLEIGHQMDIESIPHSNINDRPLPAQFKPGQVETHGMTVVFAMTASASTPDPETRVPPISSTPETSPTTNLQTISPSRVSPSKKSNSKEDGRFWK